MIQVKPERKSKRIAQPEQLERLQKKEPRFTQDERDTIWELFFGKKWSFGHIAREYGVHRSSIISAIERESARRWRKQHPHEKMHVRVFEK